MIYHPYGALFRFASFTIASHTRVAVPKLNRVLYLAQSRSKIAHRHFYSTDRYISFMLKTRHNRIRIDLCHFSYSALPSIPLTQSLIYDFNQAIIVYPFVSSPKRPNFHYTRNYHGLWQPKHPSYFQIALSSVFILASIAGGTIHIVIVKIMIAVPILPGR